MSWTREKKRFAVVAAVAAAFLAVVFAVPFLLPYDPNVTDLASALLPPGEQGHLFGTDSVGRDVWLRTLEGGSESVLMAFLVVAAAFAIGIAVGLVAGFAGGAVDGVLNKVITMFQAFPSFVLAIAIAALLGQGMTNMIIAIAAVYWTQPARLARSLALSLKNSDAVKAARVCGARSVSICTKYLLPAMASPLIVMAALSLGDVILTMAGLSYLGLGPERPTNEWGAMMSEARSTFQFAPWGIAVPGVALFVAIIIFNLLGDTLRDVLDAPLGVGDADKDSHESSGRNNKKGMKMARWKKKRGVIAGAALACLTAAALIGGCASSEGAVDAPAASGNGTAPTEAAPQELVAGSTAYFYNETLDPAYNWDGWELEYYGVCENLLKLTDDFQVQPWLAESVENVDDNTWRINLRDDVVFSNGEKMTGEAVKACWERTYEVNPRAAETLAVESIEADGQTVTVTTAKPSPAFQNVICDPLFCIYYTAEGTDYENDGTPTTGPYKVTDFEFADHITLEPNENYWDGTPQLSKITLSTYLDDDAETMAMQSGELQALAMPGSTAFTTLSDASKFKALKQTSTRADFVRFNMDHPVVANDAVRLAVSYCIDREGYANTICAGIEVPSWGVYSSQLPYGGTEGLKVTVDRCDVDAAAAALDAAGVVDTDGDGVRELPDGTPCEINLFNCTSYDRFVRLADDLQSKLASIGITLNIHSVDYWLQDAETYDKDNPDMTIDSYGMAPTGDAAYFANMCFATNGSNNFGHYSNPEVDALVEKLGNTFGETERDQVVKEMSQLVLDDNAYIFFANSMTTAIADVNVDNLVVAPSEYYFITKDTKIA